MNKKVIFKWIEMMAFGFLLLGGFNFLMMGLFNFDMYGAIFGGSGLATARVFYSLFGIGAAFLFAVILWKAYMTKKPAAPVAKTAEKTAPATKTASKA